MSSSNKILILSRVNSNINNGSSSYIKAIIKGLLKTNNKVDFLIINQKCKFFEKILKTLTILTGFNFIFHKKSKFAEDVECPLNEYEKEYIQKIIKKKKYNVVISNYVYLADIFDYLDKDVKKVVITHDIQYKRNELMQKNNMSNNSNLLNKTQEIKKWNKADIIVAIQKEEAEIIRQHCPLKKVIVLPMFSKLKYSFKQRCGKKIEKQKNKLLFIGSNNKINEHAVSFLIKIFPKLENVELNIYGDVCKKFIDIKLSPDIHINGTVKNLEKVYKQNSIAVVPLIIGSGLKIKTVEALSYSMPVIGTSYAFEGLRDSINYCCCEANNEEEFIYAINNMFVDTTKYELSASNAEQYFLSNFTEKVAMKALNKEIS